MLKPIVYILRTHTHTRARAHTHTHTHTHTQNRSTRTELGFSCTFRADFKVDAHRSLLAARSNEPPDACKQRSFHLRSVRIL